MTWTWFKSDNRTFEDLLRPGDKAWPLLDITWICVLAAMGMLLPVWPTETERAFNDVVGQMLSPYLLPALGMLLAMRLGAIDLSVWASMAAGGAVAALTIIASSGGAGAPPAHSGAWGLAAGAAAGLAVGLINGVIIWRLRLPSPIVTIVVAGIVTLAMAWSAQGSIQVPDTTFANWHIEQDVMPDNPPDAAAEDEGPVRVVAPISVTRMLLVLAALAATVLVLMVAASGRREPSRRARQLLAGMAASGTLSALGGAIWLVEYQSTPVPDQLIGTWRIPAAAVLAGSFLLTGPGRTLVAAIFLPPAMAVAVAWRGQWSSMSPVGDLPLIALVAMAIVAQATLARARSNQTLPGLAAAFATAGLVIMAGAGRPDAEHFLLKPQTQQHLLRLLALALSSAAAVLLIALRHRRDHKELSAR